MLGERVVGVDVDGQALAGVQELDQQRRVRASAGGVVRAEEGDRVGRGGVAQQAAVGQAAEAERVVAEYRRRRADPVLGHPVARGLGAAQRGDLRAAEVEARDAVGRQQDGVHSGTSPDPRATSSHGIVRRWGGPPSPSSRA